MIDGVPHNTGPECLLLREACFVPLDPALDGFHGVLIELYEQRGSEVRRMGGFTGRYVIVQSAALSGNMLTRIRCEEEATALRVYADVCKSGTYPAP